MTDWPRDEHGRASIPDREVPPATEHFAHWRGRLTHPYATHTPAGWRHGKVCVGGWIGSGDWWLHCGVCRPEGRNVA